MLIESHFPEQMLHNMNDFMHLTETFFPVVACKKEIKNKFEWG